MINSNYTVIGVGRAYNANSTYKWYWTTDFGGYSNPAVDAAAGPCGGSTGPTPTPVRPTPTAAPPIPTPSPIPTQPSGGSGGAGLPLTISMSGRTTNSNSSVYAYGRNLSTAWISTATYPPYAYVYFDLGRAATVKTIQWVFNQSGLADQLLIQVSGDHLSWSTVATVGNAPPGQRQSLSWGGRARYIRFWFNNPNRDSAVGGLAEVQFLG